MRNVLPFLSNIVAVSAENNLIFAKRYGIMKQKEASAISGESLFDRNEIGKGLEKERTIGS